MTRRNIFDSVKKAADTLPLTQAERQSLKSRSERELYDVRAHILRVIDKLHPERKRKMRLAEIEAMTGWSGSTLARRLAQGRKHNLHGGTIAADKVKNRGGNRLDIATYDLKAIEKWLRADYANTWEEIQRLKRGTPPKLEEVVQSVDGLSKPTPFLNVNGKLYAHIATLPPEKVATLLESGLEIMNISMFDALLRCEWTNSAQREPVSAIFEGIMLRALYTNDKRAAERRAQDLEERDVRPPAKRKTRKRSRA